MTNAEREAFNYSNVSEADIREAFAYGKNDADHEFLSELKKREKEEMKTLDKNNSEFFNQKL